MNKYVVYLEKVSKWIIGILFVCMVTFLGITGLLGSCYVNNDEYTYYVSDNIGLQVVLFLVFLMFILIYRRWCHKNRNTDIKKYLWYGVLGVYAILALWFALYTQIEPRADQKNVVETAMNMIAGDYSAFELGGYMDVYPNQVGIVYIFYWLFRMFPFGYNTIRVLNVIALLGAIWSFNGIGKMLLQANKQKNQYIVGVVTVLFLPLLGYVTFLYGNTIGLGLSMLGIYCTCKYFDTRKVFWMVVSIVTLALAVVVKENYLIHLIGVIIFLLLDFLHKPTKKTIMFLVVIVLATFGATSLVKFHTSKITGEKISAGVPTLAWVAMGLQDGYMASGWHNQYNEDVYREHNCDTQLANIAVQKEIGQRIQEMIQNPGATVSFFYKKVISQWNNPTFECFWVNDLTKRQEKGIAVKKMPEWMDSFLGEPGNKIVTIYMNSFQTILLWGVCIWFLAGWKEIKLEQLLMATIFIGGFLFHLVWEAKCQYVLPYFVLLIPYAVWGYQLLLERLEGLWINGKWTVHTCVGNKWFVSIVTVCAILVVLSLVAQPVMDKMVGFSNQAYQEFLRSLE